MSGLKGLLSRSTPKYKYLHKSVGQRPFKLLDVGAGNNSPSTIKSLFPNCEYHGIDLDLEYNYNATDKQVMHAFYAKDLTLLDYSDIPDNYFDYINMAHIIEHLHNGDKVLEKLAPKLKKGGYIYIEYPGQKSTTLPSMYGTLNFYDDNTHARIYSYAEIGNILKAQGFTVLSGGMRRSWMYILALPARAIISLIKNGKLHANVFWDLLGFAEYVYARKDA